MWANGYKFRRTPLGSLLFGSASQRTRRGPQPKSDLSDSANYSDELGYTRVRAGKGQSGQNPGDDAGWFFVIKERHRTG
jgi:hypothetical protein